MGRGCRCSQADEKKNSQRKKDLNGEGKEKKIKPPPPCREMCLHCLMMVRKDGKRVAMCEDFFPCPREGWSGRGSDGVREGV